MNQPVKVVHIIDHLSEGGRERRMVELLKELSKSKAFQILAVVLRKDVHYKDIFGLSDTEVILLERKTKKDPGIFFQLYKICRKFNPDIVHTWSSMSSLYIIPIAKWLNIKLVNGMVSNASCVPFSSNHIRAKITFLFSDVILSNSKAGARIYKVPEKKSRVIRNGFNFKRIENIEIEKSVRNKYQIHTRYVVGMVGSIDDRKDYKTYIRAAIDVLSKRNDVTFVVVGTGNRVKEIKDMIPDTLTDKIRFLGKLNNVESVVNIFDIGVLTTFTEGISNAIMEYMALEKPVIVTRGGGTDEIVLDKRTGFIIDHASKDQLKEKILYLLSNTDLAKKMGEMGRKRIMKEFHIKKMTEGTVRVYEELLQKKIIDGTPKN